MRGGFSLFDPTATYYLQLFSTSDVLVVFERWTCYDMVSVYFCFLSLSASFNVDSERYPFFLENHRNSYRFTLYLGLRMVDAVFGARDVAHCEALSFLSCFRRCLSVQT